jgi:hypothetical protein
MSSLLGFELDFWDYATFLAVLLCVAVVLTFVVWIAGLPGRVAIARKHPEAEAVKIMGYAGFLAVVPWIQAFIWAYKPTDVVDIRRFPVEEAAATEVEIARLSGQGEPADASDTSGAEAAHDDAAKR